MLNSEVRVQHFLMAASGALLSRKVEFIEGRKIQFFREKQKKEADPEVAETPCGCLSSLHGSPAFFGLTLPEALHSVTGAVIKKLNNEPFNENTENRFIDENIFIAAVLHLTQCALNQRKVLKNLIFRELNPFASLAGSARFRYGSLAHPPS